MSSDRGETDEAGKKERKRWPGWLWIGGLAAAGLLAACSRKPPAETVVGTEDPNLVNRWDGALVSRTLDLIELPSLKWRAIPIPRHEQTPCVVQGIETCSGPDREGRMAFMDTYSQYHGKWTDRPDWKRWEKRYTLKVICTDGTGERTVFTREGEPGFTGQAQAMGDRLALAPVGGHVAFVSDMHGVQFHHPDVFRLEGTVEVWDIAHSTGGNTRLSAVDDGISWFPDGRRLACVTLAPRENVPRVPMAPDGFGAGYAAWERIPCVTVLDTETGKVRVLHAGLDPVVSADGRAILACDSDGHVRRIDAETGASTPVRLPGQAWSYEGSLLAYRDGMALYWALPTEGADVRYTTGNSPLVGPKEMLTIKIADLDTGAFQTVIPYLDPRNDTTYGPAPSP